MGGQLNVLREPVLIVFLLCWKDVNATGGRAQTYQPWGLCWGHRQIPASKYRQIGAGSNPWDYVEVRNWQAHAHMSYIGQAIQGISAKMKQNSSAKTTKCMETKFDAVLLAAMGSI